ncbi:MAG: DNA topoisomerase IV subunit A [Erysipelotrichaceae bacterium]|nr:DNA topoisomerase IV subunit A [Erysipelotrichaceae bacterium]
MKTNENNNNLIQSLQELMQDRFGRYSKYIIQERALPDVRDGLKPVQRRILYAMYDDGNTHDKGYRKSAKTVGLVIGNYHPHGDSSVYEAMVRMSQYWKMNLELVDMQGNNGSIDDDPAAAMRYTEARLSAFGESLLEDIRENTVNFAPNFDDTSKEPTVLPARIPELLTNGATGIAAGYATNIPPHNISEIIDAAVYRIHFPTCSLEELEEKVQGPDFPTGGLVQGTDGIHEAFLSGKVRVVIRAKTTLHETRTINQIVITEIPYEVVKVNMVKKIDEIRLNKNLDGLLDVRDESDRNGLRIVLDIKKEADAQLILNYLYKNTDLQVYYNYNMIAIVDQRPVLLGLREMLDAFIKHRKEVVLRRSRFQYDDLERRCHILEGLMRAVSVLDEVITIIRSSKDKGDAKSNLMKRFDFSDAQAEAIVTLRLYRLTSTDIVELRNEFALLVNEMEYLQSVINSDEMLKSVIVKELKEAKTKFDRPRRTIIEGQVQEIVIDKMSMIPNERTVVTVSRDAYVKRVSLRSFQASENTDTGLKENDQLVGSIECDTYDTLVLFTQKGNYAYLPVYSIEDAKWKEVGNHLSHYLKADGEKIVSAMIVKNFKTYAWIVTVSAQGLMKKTAISEFEVTRNNKTFDAMVLQPKDRLVSAFVLYENEDILLASQQGYMVRYAGDSISEIGTKAKGVKAMNLSTGDLVGYASAIREGTNAVLFYTHTGQYKRIRLNEIGKMNRPAKGELLAKRVKSNPQNISYLTTVGSYDVLRLTQDKEQWIAVKDVPIMAKDATFSVGPKGENLYVLIGIEEIKIVDLPVKPTVKEETHHDVEMLSFDL